MHVVASDADRVLANKREMAKILRWSLPTLDAWISKHPDFPIEQRGSVGVEYLFDPRAVVEFIRSRREDEERLDAKRVAALAQFALPIDEVAPEGATALGPAARASLAQARLREQQLARNAGLLVETSKVRKVLAAGWTTLGRGLDALPGQIGRNHNLSDDVVRDIRKAIDDHRRAAVRELKEFFLAQVEAEEREAARVAPDGSDPYLEIVKSEEE